MKRIRLLGVRLLWVCVLMFGGMVGCNDSGDDGPDTSDIGDNDLNTVVCLGDSITFGTGIPSSQSYPSQLAGLTGKRVINAGVPGETSGSGAGRAQGLLNRHSPAFMIVLYGANDIIKGMSRAAIAENLRRIVQACKANQTIPILATITPMFGPHAVFNPSVDAANEPIRAMAKEEGVDIVDLNAAMQDPGLFNRDGLHPNAAGAALMAARFQGQVQ